MSQESTGIPRCRSVHPAAHHPRVRWVVQPRQVGQDQGAGRFTGSQRQRQRAPQIRLKPRLDFALRRAACRLNRLGVREDLPRHVGRRRQRPAETRPMVHARGLNDAGKHPGIAVDQHHTRSADPPQLPACRCLRHQFLQQCCGECCAQRSHAAPADPRTPAGDFLEKPVNGPGQPEPRS